MVLRLKARKSRSPPGLPNPPPNPTPLTRGPATHTPPRGGAAGSLVRLITVARPAEPREALVEQHPGPDPGPRHTHIAGWSSPAARQAHNHREARRAQRAVGRTMPRARPGAQTHAHRGVEQP